MTSKVYVALRVRASPERAFTVFTQEIGDWWRPNGLFPTTPRAPGRLAFEDARLIETLADGKVFQIGRVLAWEPPARLVFSWRQASFPPTSIRRLRFVSRPWARRPGSASSTGGSTRFPLKAPPAMASRTTPRWLA